MKPEDIEKIKSEIKEGGIPLQIYSSLILDKLGWAVKQNCFYNLLNKQGESGREIDITGEKESFVPRWNNFLIFECKKSRKPWVFFKQEDKIKMDPFIVTAVAKEGFLIYDFIKSQFVKFHYLDKEIHTYFHTAFFKEDFKKEKQYSPIYKAIKQVLNGLIFISNQNEDFLSKKPIIIDGYFLYPIIVLDGELFSAQMKDDGEINLEEKKHISLLLNLEAKETRVITGKEISQGLKAKKIIIDIVKKEYLEEFLKNSFSS